MSLLRGCRSINKYPYVLLLVQALLLVLNLSSSPSPLNNAVVVVNSFTPTATTSFTPLLIGRNSATVAATATPICNRRVKQPFRTASVLNANNNDDDRDDIAATTSTSIEKNNGISLDNIRNKNILVVGGSGRVGGSVVCKLLASGAKVTVGGTNEESYLVSKSRWESLFSPSSSSGSSRSNSIGEDIPQSTWDNEDLLSFVQIDREDAQSIRNVLQRSITNTKDYDLVVHTAGPFQGKVKSPNGVIAAAIECGVPYVDVCDDYCTATAAKAKYATSAVENNVPCIVSTGCWPGVSSLMAKQLTASVLKKNTHLEAKDLTVDFSFFTAGSGGAGSTLLVATFLILAEKSLMVVNGRRREVDAMKEYSRVNFGPIVGDKDVAHLNLLEAASVHDVLGVGNVKTLFGTAPGFWNTLLGAMAQLPSSLLSNEPIMEKLALFSLPIVRVVDYFAGATNAMRCDVSCSKDPSVSEMALYAHENLEPCVGECVVGFCAAVLGNCVDSGVHFPEEAIEGGDDLAQVLRLTSVGAHTLEVQSNSGLTKKDMWGVSGTNVGI